MKVDLIRKFKWYIVGFVLVAIMLSVSLSFCTWDSLSVKTLMQSKSGGFELKWNDYIKDADGNTIALSKSPQVGDIVTLGKYYQNITIDNNVADKTAIRWIVVHSENNQLTLLAEKVMAFGSFWGTHYYDIDNNSVWGTQVNGTYYQNYSQSTVRAWLNSDYTLRNDGGTEFSADSIKPTFRGFLSEAFTADEKAFIVSKSISGMKGAGKYENSPQENYESVEDKVWIPSYTEVFGDNTGLIWGVGSDNLSDVQFTHFKNGGDKIGKTTAFASTTTSNYTMDTPVLAGIQNYQKSLVGDPVYWWLRSPYPSMYTSMLRADYNGKSNSSSTYNSGGGVRPAVNVQL